MMSTTANIYRFPSEHTRISERQRNAQNGALLIVLSWVPVLVVAAIVKAMSG
jgi:hypothetical protein